MSTKFEETLNRLRSLTLEYNRTADSPVSLALIGGLALGAWGLVRATQDVDFLLDAGRKRGVEEFLQFLSEREVRCNSITSSPDDPLPFLIELPSDLPVPVHLIVATRNWEAKMIDESIEVELRGDLRIPVVQPGHLLLLKLRAGGPQDLLDAESLVRSMRVQALFDESVLREMAAAMNMESELEAFLGRLE